MVGLVVILAGGIGGGLAGGLAASHQPSTSQSEPTTMIPPKSNTSETMATVTSGDVIPSSTVTSNLRVGTVTTDGGCPELNGTIYTPREGNGKPYSNASFMKLCSTDFSDVILSYRSHDILRVRVESLDQCIQIAPSIIFHTVLRWLKMFLPQGIVFVKLCRWRKGDPTPQVRRLIQMYTLAQCCWAERTQHESTCADVTNTFGRNGNRSPSPAVRSQSS
ncbi:uncharacterized protein QC761_103685 [Podospora bellae-mahoneyi]|uniref:Uncharacterized protein n=1 Tax=Podospora bellae-mahoneyi TaxID=2093777 RepID=A0ABR0FUR6_9PEZI|nr:hypothetical protein QC761_103685 [Podospora bellae-mahoneyi]